MARTRTRKAQVRREIILTKTRTPTPRQNSSRLRKTRKKHLTAQGSGIVRAQEAYAPITEETPIPRATQ